MSDSRSPRVSVVLCSKDRRTQVEQCLDRFDMTELAAVDGELVLVDNASDDGTLDCYETFRAGHEGSRVKVCSEPRRGLSHARNTGVAASAAERIVFLDDDVYLESGYLPLVIRLFDEHGPQTGVLGGRILRFDPQDSLYCCQLSERQRTYEPGSPIRPGAVQGANFAIRRAVFDGLGGFDPELGAGKQFRCEDVDFIARALQHGWQAVYDPTLVVFHHHGRRDGPDVESLRRDNSYAAGAFFAKMHALGYGAYRGLLAAYVLSAPIRPNMKLGPFLDGWRDYRREFPAAKQEPVG